MDPYDELHRGRLSKAMKASYGSLEPFRGLVRGLVEEYTGPGYGEKTSDKREILLNLTNQAVDAYTMSLAANRPRVLISTPKQHLGPFARHFQEAMNNLIKEIGLEHTIRHAVLDAFFCIGVVKIHLADSAPVELEQGIWMDPGQPFASCVSLDNWCHDVSAQRYDQVKFAADSYRIPMADLKTDLYDQRVVDELVPTSKFGTSDEERLEEISRGRLTDHDEFEPMVDLMDVWVPRDGKIYTFPMDPRDRFTTQHPPVAVMEWDGPEHGPYRLLGFNDVPENIMPASPASHLAGLGRLVNNLMRKHSKQARRQKDVYTYSPTGAEGAKKVKDAGDGQWVEVQSAGEIGVTKMGGVDQANQAFLLNTVEMFDRMAGNLSAKLGLGPQAETVGQEKLIHGAVSAKEASMQNRAIDFARGIVLDLGKMLWDDQAKVIPGRIPVEGAPEYGADSTWRPSHREGEFLDYDLDIDVFSMPYQSPGQRAQALNQLLTTIYFPLRDQLATQGGTIDLQELVGIHSELLSMPRLKRVVKFVNAPPPESGPGKGGSPAMTSREYVRRSVPTGGTQRGRQHVQQQAWLDSGRNNQAQEASLANSA